MVHRHPPPGWLRKLHYIQFLDYHLLWKIKGNIPAWMEHSRRRRHAHERLMGDHNNGSERTTSYTLIRINWCRIDCNGQTKPETLCRHVWNWKIQIASFKRQIATHIYTLHKYVGNDNQGKRRSLIPIVPFVMLDNYLYLHMPELLH